MEKFIIAVGTSGMRLATAKLLFDKGYSVTILGRNQNKLNAAIKELEMQTVLYISMLLKTRETRV